MTVEQESHVLMEQKDAEIAALQARVESLSKQLHASLTSAQQQGGGKRRIPLSPHAVQIREIRDNANGGNDGNNSRRAISRERLGRNASLGTRGILEQLSQAADAQAKETQPSTVQRILDMFQRPEQHMDYLNSQDFAKDLYKLAVRVRQILEGEPRVIFLQSPCYVFGDIHGNLEDLHFFSDNIWRLGMNLTAGNFLFLGDYVDRGLSCLETVAYLFAMKQQLPGKVFLLRGNHETRDVNGWEEHYGERSFIWQCRNRFGDDLGYRIWETCNQVFDRMPLSAVIDQDIFCVHGGIPRPISLTTTRIQDILTVPKVAGINPPYEHETDEYQQVASDCIWSDPASENQEMTSVDPETGFGESMRGGGAICFGQKAVTDFLQQQDFSYIMRAHEAHADGVAVSKGARVFTVFSTSKDHNQGSQAMAGCILVDNDKLQVINRSPAYKNQYVHRRDSISLANLSAEDIAKRIQLGLVTPADDANSQDDDDDEGYVDWEDFEDDDRKDDNDSSEEFIVSKSRRASVDLVTMMENVHDAAEWEQESSGILPDYEPTTKRQRSKRPSVASISEGMGEEEEVETVNGDEDIELHDA